MKRYSIWRLAVVAAAFLIYLFFAPVRNGVDRAVGVLAGGQLEPLKDYILGFGWWGPLVSILLMVLQALVLPLPAFVITFTNAWLYGWGWGALLSWSGAMLAAALCYSLARWFGRPLVERLVGKGNLAATDGFFQRRGAWAILITRLIPVISFDLISYAAGLTSVGLWTFLWATGLGQLPATLVYSYLGHSMGEGAQGFLWGLSLAFLFVAFGWGMRQRFKNKPGVSGAGNGYED